MKKFNVVAAVILKNNKFFIAQRNRNKHMGLCWEFPGGKVEKNENFEQALKREIKEELSINILINKKIGMENYQDDKINVRLHYYLCKHIDGEFILNEHEDSAWITKNEFNKYNFAEGDKDIISLL